MKSVILLGAPGSGKGTVAKILKDLWEVSHISTGDIFRLAIKNQTPMGVKASEYTSQGKLVPDEITIGVVDERFNENDVENGFILDGFPRTVNQAVEFDRILKQKSKELSGVLLFNIDEDLVVRRICGRRVCSNCGAIYHIENIPSKKIGICDICGGNLVQRKDDNESVIRERLLEYNEQTAPLVDYYKNRNVLYEIDASTNPEKIVNNIKGLDI